MTTAAAPAARRMLVPPLISAGKLVRKDATNCRRDVGVPTTSMNAIRRVSDVFAKSWGRPSGHVTAQFRKSTRRQQHKCDQRQNEHNLIREIWFFSDRLAPHVCRLNTGTGIVHVDVIGTENDWRCKWCSSNACCAAPARYSLQLAIDESQRRSDAQAVVHGPVSYTHLTLPTKRIV